MDWSLTLTYRVFFILGGAVFAAVTYVLGSAVYEIEHLLLASRVLEPDFAGVIPKVQQQHALTFAAWVFGTMCLFALVGHLFDKQVKYRQLAENYRVKAEARADTDSLTTVFNHGYFIEQLALEMKRAKRFGQSFVLIFLDIDNFKQYNDDHGHQAGDRVLKQVALAAKTAVRETDLVARYGGEEFVIMAVGTDKQNGAMLAERIRDNIERKSPATVSLGVAAFPEDGDCADRLINTADEVMYEAKLCGKNCVCVAENTSPPAPRPNRLRAGEFS